MKEKQIIPVQEQSDSNTNQDRDYTMAAKIAAGVVGTLIVGGAVADNINRNNMKNELRDKIANEQEHNQAVLDEIDAKAHELFIHGSEDSDDMVGFIPVIGDTDLYGASLALIPEEDKSKDFIYYTVSQSAKAQGIYQPEDSFGLFADEIDGQETYIVRPVDNSVANTEVKLKN